MSAAACTSLAVSGEPPLSGWTPDSPSMMEEDEEKEVINCLDQSQRRRGEKKMGAYEETRSRV